MLFYPNFLYKFIFYLKNVIFYIYILYIFHLNFKFYHYTMCWNYQKLPHDQTALVRFNFARMLHAQRVWIFDAHELYWQAMMIFSGVRLEGRGVWAKV